MFESLSQKLSGAFERLTRRGALSEGDVDEALREVRVALLEADVALPVVKDFIAKVREAAVGEAVLKSITPGQMVVKIVHDHLVEALGSAAEGINLATTPPAVILMVGLQGSGKTTSTAKIAMRLTRRDRKRVLMASLDTRRPAAQQQLATLGQQAEVKTLNIVAGEPPLAIAKRAVQTATLEAYDVLMLDSAGRLHIDEELMDEIAAIKTATKPIETLLVADAMTGQDAVNVAKTFQDRIGVTGIMLTRVDGDARGGAALSMRAVTGQPIKLLGIGEKLDALEDFHPDRIAGRILGMGDVVSLVEKAAETIEQAEAERLAKKMQKGQFDLDDLADQLKQLQKMGGLGDILGMLPGVAKIKAQMKNAKIDDKVIGRQRAILSSMTRKERKNPDLIKASRKQRIAAGSGTTVQEVNKLLKQHQEMARMMKQMGKMGQKGLMRHGIQSIMPRG
ncbi:signal recognition particle protein [Hypericibacter adhaerens]|uniref:Signal recognition particle protein n=1 Tax=Hypericibacter adhaerens TaxID=2602016 RepID=A0A5J6N7I3_9PROT|nr:signal recognition particle protein [Hypericibacter adhaerens]QEX24803.1 signal recognition particle protein [Hypericibacter adhaerens]